MHQLGQNTIKWYTDGLKTSIGTGASVYGPRINYSKAMGTYPSIFQAEIHSIDRCAQFNLDRKYRGRDIAILVCDQGYTIVVVR